jgi:hypothetical protein
VSSTEADDPAESRGGGRGPQAHDILDAWRRRGADRLDPVRFRFIEVMARRTAAHEGEVRRVLDTRLAHLLTTYGADVERSERLGMNAHAAPSPQGPGLGDRASARGPIAELLDRLTHSTGAHGETRPGGSAEAALGAAPQLKTVRYFKRTWDRLSTEQRLADSLTKAPKNAGPLNSQRLVHRSLSLMRDVSPEYLNHLVSYVDTLLWLDRATGGGATTRTTGAAHTTGDTRAPRRGR